jgi:hypothetical protein
MNMPKLLIPSLMLASLSTAMPALAVPNMEEGNWEITTKMEMAGMPFAMPPTKHNQCMTKKEAIPDQSRKGQDCTVTDQKMTGDTVSWRMQCKDKEGTTDGEGKITYAGKSYDGAMNMKMTSKKGEVNTMKMSFQGRHTGPCKSPPGKKAGDY